MDTNITAAIRTGAMMQRIEASPPIHGKCNQNPSQQHDRRPDSQRLTALDKTLHIIGIGRHTGIQCGKTELIQLAAR